MNRHFPILVFLVTATIGCALTWFVYQATEANNISKFERVADEAAVRVILRVEQHLSLLMATRSYLEAIGGAVDRNSFRVFVNGLGIEDRYEGIQGIGFAKAIKTGSELVVEEGLLANYGLARNVWPETDQPERMPIMLIEPDDTRNRVALGFDMFSEPRRRRAMVEAAATGEARATAPVELVQEITRRKQTGFLVYLPFNEKNHLRTETRSAGLPVEGFLFAPFRAGDLHLAALSERPILPVYVETFDITDGEEQLLFQSVGLGSPDIMDDYLVEKSVDLLGRQWHFRIRPTPAFSGGYGAIFAFVVGVVSLLLAATLALTARAQQRAAEVSRELQGVLETNLRDKDLMLNEMKHRIKNALSRIMAISRHTAANSDSLEDYSKSFSARLEAMSTAQDMLTQGRGQTVGLRELLEKELQQIFGYSIDSKRISGPDVKLGERGTQALGLTFHELATNALKYGGVAETGGDLTVAWEFAEDVGDGQLDITWFETSNQTIGEPETVGFGSRLIQASIEGELGGRIDRQFSEDGMNIRITIPSANLA